MTKTNIYILRLQGEKYYIGKSDNPEKRFEEHKNGCGSSWTKKYKPIEIIKILSNVSHFEEDKVTKEYMDKYGINNVRGGTYVSIELDEIQLETLKREIWGAKNKCTTCGRSGHFAKACYATTDIYGDDIYELVSESESDSDSSEDDYESTPSYKKQNINCFRCGREGHYATTCYASKHVKGYKLY